MKGKRQLLAQTSFKLGLTRLLEVLPKRRALLVLNYHRIGNPDVTPYDPGTFGPTAEEFDWQLGYLKRRFCCVTLEEALAMVTGEAPFHPSLLITLDDGYLDNYQVAFPLLDCHGLTAVFFLPTSFIGTQKLPWWDTIAYIVKHSRRNPIQLRYPESAEFHIKTQETPATIFSILNCCIRNSVTDYARLVDELESACDCQRPGESAERCFINWNEAREMQRGGMAFGSHSHSHEILSGLSYEQQAFELSESRSILERELGTPIDVLAYPVGLRYTFSGETIKCLEGSGFKAGFSFYGGLNCAGTTNRFDIKRCDFSVQSNDHFRLATVARTLLNQKF